MDEQKQETQTQDPIQGCPEPLRPVLQGLIAQFPDADFGFDFFLDEATVTVDPSVSIDVVRFLKETKEHGFEYLVDVGGLNDPKADNEYIVFYNLLSISTLRRLRIKVPAKGTPPTVPSLTCLYEAANWHERETFDMFGIVFEGHPNMKRIFLPDHVKVHPLRKDYPLQGDNDKPTW